MKIVSLAFFLLIFDTSKAQLRLGVDSIKKELQLTNEQVMKIVQIDSAYVLDMEGMKSRAETGYNPPKDIQYQHKFILLRRFKAYKELLNADQYEKMRILRFDIYRNSKWLADFYKKSKLPTIEEALAKLEKVQNE